jgi:1-acyl-sn-glycerol-3-phosphate acyltransferase
VTARAGLVGSATARPNAPYRLVRLLCRIGARLFRVRVTGLEHLPREQRGRPTGGWICAGFPHRTWAEPLILLATLPAEPRLAMMADAQTALGSWWRRLLVGWVGGVVAIPRRAAAGVRGFDVHARAVAQVIDAGAVFSVFPEVGAAAHPPELRRVSPAVAYFALRTGAPIVPVVFGGTHDLFLRRPIEMRVLPPLTPAKPPPPAGSTTERQAADAFFSDLLDAVRPVAAELHEATLPSPGTRRRWRWLQAGFPRLDEEG